MAGAPFARGLDLRLLRQVSSWAPISAEGLTKLDATGWELYHVAEDFAENHNIADQHRDKLIEMISLWYVEAGRYNVLPIDSRGATRIIDPRPQASKPRRSLRLLPGHPGCAGQRYS